jgi:hypothetical protein
MAEREKKAARLAFSEAHQAFSAAVAAMGGHPYNLLHAADRDQRLDAVSERLDALKELSLFAGDAVRAGGSLADGAAAVAAGRLIAAIDGSDDEQLLKISSAIASLRGGDSEVKRVKLMEQKVKQNERKLAFEEKRWRMRTAEIVLAQLKDSETMRLVAQPGLDNDAKIQLLGKRLFGEDW